MTPTPFTGDVLRAIIAMARQDIPAEAIAIRFGWDLPKLARVNRDHRIGLFVPEASRVVTQPAPAPAPVQAVEVIKPEPEPQPDLAPKKRHHPYITLNVRQNIIGTLQSHIARADLSLSAGLGLLIVSVMKDDAAFSGALSEAARKPYVRGTGEPTNYEARLTDEAKASLAQAATTDGRSKSWVANAIFEYVIERDLWDAALGRAAQPA